MNNRRDERARRDENRARQRTLTRERSQPATWRLGWMARPAERSAHQVSTAHFQAAYPAIAEPGLGSRGVYIGRDLHGGSFVYDPWVLYQQGVLNDANMLVIGRPGYGKSALLKTWMYRSRVFGRTCELIDPKGEYAPLTRALGGEVLRFTPGGQTRLNPLTRLGSREMREGLLEAIARAMLDRPLTQPEALGLAAALAAADQHADGNQEVCIPDVTAQLRDPTEEVAARLATTREEAQSDLRECALALQRLTHGPLRGMFDQPTHASETVWDAPAVCLDLSHVGVGQAQSNLAVAIVMVCASAFLDAKRHERAQQARAVGRDPDKTTRGNDECWRGLPIPGLADYYQSAFKLSRDSGVQHILALHRLSDLRSAGDDGSRQQRLAQGLLAEASTNVVYRQHAQEVPDTADALGLSSTARERIARLPAGVALWCVGGRCFEVRHHLSDREWELIDTDQAMGQRRATPRAAERPEYEQLRLIPEGAV
jgi:type IV secretory pathway VirB4 component